MVSIYSENDNSRNDELKLIQEKFNQIIIDSLIKEVKKNRRKYNIFLWMRT